MSGLIPIHLLLGLLVPAHGRAEGGHGPFPQGKGWGMGGLLRQRRSSAPSPGPPPALIPPQVPLEEIRGRSWGDGGGLDPAHALPTRRRSGGRAAAKTPPCPALRRLRGRRDTKRSDWRGGRAAARHFRGAARASGVAGGRGDDLAGRRERRSADGQFVKRARSRAAGRKKSPRARARAGRC